MEFNISRRRILTVTALTTTGVAGCANRGPGGQTETTPDTTTETATETDAEVTDEASPTDTSPTAGSKRTETVTFQSTAGTTVKGTLYGRGDCGVVLVPQINMDRPSWKPQATMLAERGHAALAIDEDPDHRWESALGAARFLRSSKGVSRLVLVGASSGGEAVVRANANAKKGSIDGLVTISAGGGAEVADQLQGQKLFVASKEDDKRFVQTAKDLHRKAPKPKALKLYEGSAHGQRIFNSPHGTDLTERLLNIVKRSCGG